MPLQKNQDVQKKKENDDFNVSPVFKSNNLKPLEAPDIQNIPRDTSHIILDQGQRSKKSGENAEAPDGSPLEKERFYEKKWLSEKLDNFVKSKEDNQKQLKEEEERKKAEEQRLKEEERLKKEENNRKLIEKAEKVEQYESEHTRAENSKRLKKIMDGAERKRSENRTLKSSDTLVHVPEKTALAKEYSKRFVDKLNDDQRKSKILNKKSRLFQKAANAKAISKVSENVRKARLEKFTLLVTKEQDTTKMDLKDVRDVSQFLTFKNEANNKKLMERFFGKNSESAAGNRLEGQDVPKALDMMAAALFNIDISSLNLMNDTELTRNAETLETISNQVAAFDRLSEKYHYGDLTPEVKERLDNKLNSLRSIAAYYNIRKTIIENKIYREHYNDELSMDMDTATDNDHLKLSNLLLQSYTLGTAMMAANGADEARIRRRGTPEFTNRQSGLATLNRIKNNVTSEKGMKNINRKAADNSFNEESVREAIRKTEAFKEREVQRQKEETERQERENKERISREAQERKKEWQPYIDKAIDNALSYKGMDELKEGYADREYSDAALEEDLKVLEEIKITDIKFGSFKEIIDNYAANLELCEKALKTQRELCRGLNRGFEITDNRLNELRAKFMFFFEVRTSMVMLHKNLISDEKLFESREEEWNKIFSDNFRRKGTDTRIMAIPGEDINALFEKYKNKVNSEYESRDDTIKNVWKILGLGIGDSEIPEGELKERRDAYSKNAAIAELLNNQVKSYGMGSNDPSALVINAYEKKNGLPHKALTRTVGNILIGLAPDEMIRMYKLITGTPGEQFKFWKEVDDKCRTLSPKDFNIGDTTTLFDNFEKKQYVSRLHANYKDVGNGMLKALEKDEKGWMKLPERYKDEADLKRSTYSMQNWGYNYTAGRYSGLSQTPCSQGRAFFSLKELGNLSYEKTKRMRKRLDKLEAKEDPLSDEPLFQDMDKVINQVSGAINHAIDTRNPSESAIKAGKNVEIATFDKDIEVLLKETEEEYDREAADEKRLKDRKDMEDRQQDILNRNSGGFEVLGLGGVGFIMKSEAMKAELDKMPRGTASEASKYNVKFKKYLEERKKEWNSYIDNNVQDESEKEYLKALSELTIEVERKKNGYSVLKKSATRKHAEVPSTAGRIDELLAVLSTHPYRTKKNRNPSFYIKDKLLIDGEKLMQSLSEEKEKKREAFRMEACRNEGGYLHLSTNADEKWEYYYNDKPGEEATMPAKSSLAASRLMEHLGVGNLMIKVEESETTDEAGQVYRGIRCTKRAQRSLFISDIKSLEENPKIVYSPDAIRQLSILQVMNFIMGNSEFDPENDIYLNYATSDIKSNKQGEATETVYYITSVFFANQFTAFSYLSGDEIKKKQGSLPAFNALSLPALDSDFVEAVLYMKPGDLKDIVGGAVDEEGLRFFESRLALVQEVLKAEKEKEERGTVSDAKRKILNKYEFREKNRLKSIQDKLNTRNKQLFPKILEGGLKIQGVSHVFEETDTRAHYEDFYNNLYESIRMKLEMTDTAEDKIKILQILSSCKDCEAVGPIMTNENNLLDEICTRLTHEMINKDMMFKLYENLDKAKLNALNAYREMEQRIKDVPVPPDFLKPGVKFGDKAYNKARKAYICYLVNEEQPSILYEMSLAANMIGSTLSPNSYENHTLDPDMGNPMEVANYINSALKSVHPEMEEKRDELEEIFDLFNASVFSPNASELPASKRTETSDHHYEYGKIKGQELLKTVIDKETLQRANIAI